MEPPAASERHRAPFFVAAAVVVALDQATKHWALQALQDDPIDLIGSLRFNLVFNDGAAFSLGSGRTTAIAVVGLAVASYLLVLGWRADRRRWAVGLGIIFGGAAGNLLDRLLRAGDGVLGGHVVDFIDLQWWPVFNVADVALWVGIGLLLLHSSREGREA